MLDKALLIATAVGLMCASDASAAQIKVRDQAQFRAAVKSVKPGDEIVLADGEWRDFKILLEGRGEPGRPIALRPETKGKVILTGQSNLRLSGEHLLVSGLVFRDGHSPSDELIAFRRDSRRTASRSRVTEIVVDRFNQPDRRTQDIWVAIHGEDNRVDHSHFEGKSNAGVTLAVIRPRGQPGPNRHRIDHNYFGPRPNLGSNGGETIRIGTSEESLSDSNSIVENNYFDRCDGEIEIVSNKSGGNIFRGNVFFESQGALVLRHGNGNLVEGNVFFGNGNPHTGGIRVINRDQTVRNNYMERLGGIGFASAITVMNGVPDSVINRYHQVTGAVIERNSVIESGRITLAAGADEERSAPPVNTLFRANLVVNSSGEDPFRMDGDISGITFLANVQNPVTKARLKEGIARRPIKLARAENGLLYPNDPALRDVGVPRSLRPVAKDATGVAWYPKAAATTVAFGSGTTKDLAPGEALGRAIASAESGDTIRLRPGSHTVDALVRIDRVITIAGSGRPDQAILTFAQPTLFQIEEGGRLRLSGVTVSGARTPRSAGNSVIRTSASPMLGNYAVEIADSRFIALSGAPSFDVIATTPATLADRILIESSRFDGVSGIVVAAHSETGDKGYYNAEHVDIIGSEFRNVGQVADLFRGGKDESTFGPRFTMRNSAVIGSGIAVGASVRLSGVQFAEVSGNRFIGSGPIEVTHSVGAPQTLIANNLFDRTPMPRLTELYAKGPHRAVLAGNRTGASQ